MTQFKRLIICLLIVHTSAVINYAAAQPTIERSAAMQPYDYKSPLNIPIILSANFGEIRANHLHSGIDIKTQGVVGKPVFTIADGYVSRIFVSPSGFGKALYISHPNGTMSVYGHLDSFSPEIEELVKEQQYSRKSFAVDLYPPKDKFTFAQGDRIAFTGNSGSSGGPHLHLEIRDGATQAPLNILARNFMSVKDTIPPSILTLYYIEVDTLLGIPIHTVKQTLSTRKRSRETYILADTSTIKLAPTGYFAVEVGEKKNNTANPMGIYKIRLNIDDKQQFGIEIDKFGFDITRYSNAAILYKQAQSKRNGVYRLHTLPNNLLPIYKGVKDRGLVRFSDSSRHHIEIIATDDSGNSSSLSFAVTNRIGKYPPPVVEGIPVVWNKSFIHNGAGFSVQIPPKSLYESIILQTSVKASAQSKYSPLVQIHTKDEPLQNYITVSLNADALPERLRSKAMLATVNANGSRSSAGGSYKDGKVSASVRNFGTYCIAVDTVAPRAAPSFQNGADLRYAKSFTITISDDFSGIANYYATIDNRWALMEYDPKTRRLTHNFDNKRFPKTDAKHTLILTVKDAKDNVQTVNRTYIR